MGCSRELESHRPIVGNVTRRKSRIFIRMRSLVPLCIPRQTIDARHGVRSSKRLHQRTENRTTQSRDGITAEQLREFMRRMKAMNDRFEIPKEEFNQSVSQVFLKVMEEGLEKK